MSDVVSIVKQELQNALSIENIRGDIKVLNNKIEGIVDHQEKQTETLQTVNDKLDELFTVMNKGKGAFTFAMILSGMIGGVVTKIGALAFTKLAP